MACQASKSGRRRTAPVIIHGSREKAAARRTSMIAGGGSDVPANSEREITEISAFMIRLHRGQTMSVFSAQSLDESSSMRRGVCERPLQRMLMSRRVSRKRRLQQIFKNSRKRTKNIAPH